MTDEVTVQAAEIVDYEVEAELQLFDGPDQDVVHTAALARLDQANAAAFKLGRGQPLSAIIAALQGDGVGVRRVNLIQPAADIDCDVTQAALCTDVTTTLVTS